MITLLSPGVKRILTFADNVIGNGKPVSFTKFFGKYMKYLPSFLLKIQPIPSLTNFLTFLSFLSLIYIKYKCDTHISIRNDNIEFKRDSIYEITMSKNKSLIM